MHLAIWSLRLFYVLIMALGAFVIILPGANALGLIVAPIVLMITALVEAVVQGLLRSEKWALHLGLVICILLICSLWFTLFGVFGLWGLLLAQPRFQAATERSFNARATRPGAVNVIVAAQLLLGVLSLAGAISNNPWTSSLTARNNPSSVWSFVLSIGILSLCMAGGVYFLQRWAWYGALMTQAAALFGFINFIIGGESSLILHCCFSLVTVGYLSNPNVWHALRR
ncbi:hypothetical protein JOY44_20355 [Phormidium sp. CLA17]|uniref:hypothetical protein n=1 Tax=Leptolyngbya sp. Cla-17 TaxID=2803751 RepID=UPI0014915FFE|nr:hypothetical protein [Leptolyngbya sp. Cla-17]MBM0743945.1 hypothetical protein [Leptolyngbya sp. Cla-17]